MKYRIEYSNRRCCSVANSRNELIKMLQTPSGGIVEDVRKVYKSGVSDSVLDTYRQYITKQKGGDSMTKLYKYQVIREDLSGKRGKRAKNLYRFENDLKVGGLYVHLGSGFPGFQRVLSVTVEEIPE